jgi:MFS family permease
VIESMQKNLIRAVVMGTAFVNGFAIMSIELLGGRLLAPYFGSSVHVWGSIITVFMLSLSLGYLIGGRLSTRDPGPHIYSLFFFASALLTLPIILLADWTMTGIFVAIEDPRYGSLLTAMLLYFLPIAVMGMVSPYSIRLLVRSEQQSGRTAGMLYFISTLGSALGTLITSFYFVLWFDIDHIMWAMVALLLLCGISVLLAWHWSARASGVEL